MLQSLAQRNGVNLSVGDIDVEDLTPTFSDESEGPQPKDVAARVVAHVAHRIPGVRRIEKRFEGQDKSSGIASDIATLFAQLYARNEEIIHGAAAEALGDKLPGSLHFDRPPAAEVADEAAFLHFGPVSPQAVVHNNNNGGQE